MPLLNALIKYIQIAYVSNANRSLLENKITKPDLIEIISGAISQCLLWVDSGHTPFILATAIVVSSEWLLTTQSRHSINFDQKHLNHAVNYISKSSIYLPFVYVCRGCIKSFGPT